MDAQEKQFYDDNGYLIVRGALGADEMAQLEAELAHCIDMVESGQWRGNHLMENGAKARVIFGPYDFSPTLRKLVGRDDMVERAKAMLGGPVHVHHTKLMCKPAGVGTPQPPHQDYYYWPGKKPNQVAVYLCIDPSTVENGCLRVYPGSHKMGLVEHHEERHPHTDEHHHVLDLGDWKAKETCFLGQPGDLIFFGSLTFHRSDGNASDTPRRGVIWEYDELDNLTPAIGWGAPIPAVQFR